MENLTLLDSPRPRTTYRQVLAEPLFRLIFVVRTMGIVGETLRITSLSVLIYTSTGSPLLSALAFGAGFLPQLPGSMLLGASSDRLRPRRLIAAGYSLQCAAAAVLGLLPMPTLAALTILAGVSVLTPVFNGATNRLVADALTGDAYVLGRSLSNIASAAAQLLGLALGGATVAALGAHPALLLAGALNAGCALAVRWRLPNLPAPRATPGKVFRASWSGSGRLLRDQKVRRLLLAQWLPSAFLAGAESLVVAYAGQRRFDTGLDGPLLAGAPLGMLIGDLAVGRLLTPPARETLVVPLAAWMGIPLPLLAADPPPSLCFLFLLASGTGCAYALGLQRRFLDAVPPENQGLAFGLLSSGMMTLQGTSPVLLGAIASRAGTGPAMAIAGGAMVITAGWMATWRLRRRAVIPDLRRS
ncbi:MFS transporter [Catenulispora subtropica]|uniref:Major facilitator superfamily MFS_1 n=1 Tax=Catenulispora subtropica TaxID=450798 RepID=A0ABP5DYT0_9ACTN